MKVIRLGANETLLKLAGKTVLFSYETPVAAHVSGRGYLRTDQQFSRTTSKHINAFIRGDATTVPQADIEGLCR